MRQKYSGALDGQAKRRMEDALFPMLFALLAPFTSLLMMSSLSVSKGGSATTSSDFVWKSLAAR